jgi:hypothetical protein
MGELLKQFDGRPLNASKQNDGTVSLISQKDAARNAGISVRQQVTAVRVANIPQEKFDAAVEAEKPADCVCAAALGVRCCVCSTTGASATVAQWHRARKTIGLEQQPLTP